jgi:hypothetical protein
MNPTAPYKQTNVTLLAGMTVFNNRVPAMLEWSGDNRIRLFSTNQTTGQTGTMFDCLPQEIKKFSVAMGTATVKLQNGQKFVLEFTTKTRNNFIGGAALSVIGLGGSLADIFFFRRAAKAEEGTDLFWWKDNLTRFGVGGVNYKAKTQYRIALFSGIGILILFVVLLIIALNSASSY